MMYFDLDTHRLHRLLPGAIEEIGVETHEDAEDDSHDAETEHHTTCDPETV